MDNHNYKHYHDNHHLSSHDDHDHPTDRSAFVGRTSDDHDNDDGSTTPATTAPASYDHDHKYFHNFYDEFNQYYNHDNDHHYVVAAIDHVNSTDYDNLAPDDNDGEAHNHAGNDHDEADYFDHVAAHYYDGADNHLFSTIHNYD